MDNLTFILLKGEKVIGDVELVLYSGVDYITMGSGFGMADSTLAGGIFSTKQIKREGSVLNNKNAHAYLTNKRLVLCNAKTSLFGQKEIEIGLPFAEIDLKAIRGINKGSQLGTPHIEISAMGASNIENIKLRFLGTGESRRDRFFKLINENIK